MNRNRNDRINQVQDHTLVIGIDIAKRHHYACAVDQLDADHNDLFCRLKQCGFLRLRVQKQEEIVFAAFTDDSYETKTHILHLMTYNGELWNNLLFFRNYMNTHSAEHSAYAALKKRAAAAHPTSIPAYTEEKTAFVHRIYQLRT